jgi:arabinogalactan oligomer/maltooligosaccharide transport system substrate-binding protein
MFVSNGVKLFGDNGEDVKGSTFNSAEGKQVMQWLADQKTNAGVVDASTAAIASLQSGKVDAYLDGPWDSVAIQKALGDNFAVAAYPTADFGSGAKQMQAFLGIETFAVNSNSKNQVAAAALAEFITNEESQTTIWKEQGQVPVAKKVQEDSAVKDNAMAQATIQMAKEGNSVLMPKLPEMANMWNLAAPLIQGAYSGTIQPANFATQLETFNTNIAKSTN